MSDTASKTAPPNLVQITEKALVEIQRLKAAEPPENEGLRLGVKGGGCSGMSYKIAFDKRNDNDYVVEAEDVKVFIDPKSAIYLKGITLDFQDGLEGKGFVFVNPNASNTCGCGESFSV
jgi:iron-sulfur cluster assembly protein